MQTAVVDLIGDVLREIRVINGIDPAAAQDAAFVLRKMNRLIDQWNAKRQAIYAVETVTGSLTAGLSPHTIGPTGTFVVDSRPVSLEPDGVYWTSSGISRQITVRGMDWWALQGQKTLSTSFPTDVAYDPTWPNGSLYFWPVPNVAQTVSMQVRLVLDTLTDTSTLDLPPGYTEAVILTTAVNCLGAFAIDPPPQLLQRQVEAIGIAFQNNTETPPLETADYGMGSRGSWFDYRSGRVR